jgi:hypothetical protein
MRELHSCVLARGRELHVGQIQVARDILRGEKRVVQAQWGRKAGKTESNLYLAWAYAKLNPGSEVWIICPQRKQGKAIYWNSRRLQDFGPREWILQEKESEITLEFKNGSKIYVEGCENYDALRGINPSLVIYDEFQDHSKEFHVEVMAPNLIAKSASLMVTGTPPKKDNYYCEFRRQLLEEIAEGDTTRAYYEFPSSINPSLDKEELEKIRVRLYKSGDEKIWLREHMAQLIWGGEGAVFSPWSRDKHLKPHRVLMSALERDMHKLRWFTIFDPGSMTCFAALFACYNPYTSQLFLLDEIYETNSKNTDALSIWRRAMDIERDLFPNRPPKMFQRVYDEAAPWFHINLRKFFGNDPEFHMAPSQKNKVAGYSSKETDCSLIKQIMATDNALFVSDRCKKWVWETENYVLDEDGNYPKNHDHLNPDCSTYLVKACNFKFIEAAPYDDALGQNFQMQTQFGAKNLQTIRRHDEWADKLVEDSLNVSIKDDYFLN